ncbi:MAG TPA: BolA family protein [Gammaproteobacteria bacterium]|nr:BolA family protein [Gammaproteobacteria bacterium]
MSDPRIQRIRDELQRQLQPLTLEILDNSAQHVGHAHAGGGHFTVRIAATAFSGKSRVQRHRMVYAVLAPLLETSIHALSIKASTPEEDSSV